MSTLHSYWRSKTAWILQRNVRILLAIIGKKSDECTTKNQRRNAHGNQIQCDRRKAQGTGQRHLEGNRDEGGLQIYAHLQLRDRQLHRQ